MQALIRSRRALVSSGILISLCLGCSSSQPAAPVATPKESTATQAEATTPKEPDPEVARRAAAQTKFDELAKTARAHLTAGELDEAQADLEAMHASADAVAADQAAQATLAAKMTELENQLAELQSTGNSALRAERLASVKSLLEHGKLADADQAIGFVMSHSPTAEESATASKLAREIERRRQVMTGLRTWLEMLGSSDRKEVRTAKSELSKDGDSALPLIIELAQTSEKPAQATAAIELLRSLGRPAVTLPVLVEVLANEQRQSYWPVAVRELQRAAAPGAGQPLLSLALKSDSAAQREAALQALAGVVDPPAETLVVLLPLIAGDGPELGAALSAAASAVRVHGQFDLAAQRGLPADLTSEQQAQLAGLGERLTKIVAAGSDPANKPAGSAATAAKVLGTLTRQFNRQPLKGIKLVQASGELPEGPAAGVLDGVWDSVDAKTMWRHPLAERTSIVLDLGETRTVTGVRLWNFNEPNGAQRGWKDVEIYVTDNPPAASPVAVGIVPPAPGAAQTPDYSTVIEIPCVRGRYIELQAKGAWKPEAYSGLSELQVLGF